MVPTEETAKASKEKQGTSAPTITLPKGGGAIHGMGEKFTANPVTGTGSMSIPIATSPGRSGFGPGLSLSYDSGAGNGPFGLGWNLSIPTITRKTDKGLPKYQDAGESDVFILSGAEDLVPVLVKKGEQWQREDIPPRIVANKTYHIQHYRPRIEGLFARIERWTNQDNPEDCFWRSISKDNMTTWYGKTSDSRIADPADASRIYSWQISESYDDKGNVMVYRYKNENSESIDLSQAHEHNRSPETRNVNCYLKTIQYGNRAPYFPLLKADQPWPVLPQDDAWLFQVVFDYGEHDPLNPLPMEPGKQWTVRNDPYSSYRAGFEVRSYRLCQRVLMFHHFPDEAEVGQNCLVRSTDFSYSYQADPADVHNPIFSILLAATQTGYRRDGASAYLSKSLPPVEFEYSQVLTREQLLQQPIRTIDNQSLENLPSGLDGSNYQWLDLDGEGLSGILTEQADGWFYKRNLSANNQHQDADTEYTAARFGSLERVVAKPNAALANGHGQFMDLAGNGQTDLAVLDGPVRGFYQRTADQDWESFQTFALWPNLDSRDPNLKFIDLTGDGHADILISEDHAFVWHASLAEAGFEAAQRTAQALDEEKGPRLVFADGSQSIYLADLSGDGLTDLVRIRNGEVCYWPNLGYCRFGAKVTMDNAPWFDYPDLFDQRRIRLADVDGSGVIDILYLHSDGIKIYFNQSGNSWSAPLALDAVPATDNIKSVTVVDLLGNGTACLVWSSPLPGDAGRTLHYLDLMGGQKPHLLIKSKNNLGAETTVEYAPSTKFYLQDRRDGKPWITKLPFPVHCVVKVTVTDQWRQTAFSSRYSYHHGYFDGHEREFRGFGRVEQIDVETFGTFADGNAASPYITPDKTLYQPPVKTVTWYHTGAFLDRERILSQFESEYFPRWFSEQADAPIIDPAFAEKPLPQPDLATQGLSTDEWREALRACKGMALRQEVYELAVDALEHGGQLPVKLYSAAQHTSHIQRLQAQADNRHAVFLVTESEALTYHYELDLRTPTLFPDPRIAHTLILSSDELGNVQQSIAVTYPRVRPHEDANLSAAQLATIHNVQQERHLAYSETHYTNDAIDPQFQHYRLRQAYETQTYELTGIGPTQGFYFELAELRRLELSSRYPSLGLAPLVPVAPLLYHQLPSDNTPHMRLVEHGRTLFLQDDLAAPLPLGTLGKLGLAYEQYKLALTDQLLDAVFNDAAGNKLDAAMPDGGTVRDRLGNWQASGYFSGAALVQAFGPQANGEYWQRSGVAGFAADAAQHFYLPERYQDAFDNITTLQYDNQYDLHIQSSTDAYGNKTVLKRFDFRVLAPAEMQDANGNLSEVAFDILGMPTAMALKGKGTEADNLDTFDAALINPGLDTLITYFTGNYDESMAGQLLSEATARHLYYFGEQLAADGSIIWGQHPPCACGILREKHVAQLNGEQSPLQVAFEYADGMGAVLVKKAQAEPEPGGNQLRWIATGRTILNNKGKPVKQYEPYFSDSQHRYEEALQIGVTPILYYDATGQLIRTELPDGAFSRVEFSPWHVASYDPNDTVLETGNAWYAQKTSANATAEEKRAAQLSAVHADTPAVTFLDSLGRNVVSIAYNRKQYPGDPAPSTDEKYLTFTKLDAEGKPLWIRDARGNPVMQYIWPPMPNNQANDVTTGFVPCYDIAGNLLYQHSMDAGDRWMLNDAAGKALCAWDSNERRDGQGVAINENRLFTTGYDALHRPIAQWLTVNADAPQMIGRFEYIDTNSGIADAKIRNLCGQLHKHYDSSGLSQTERIDFKGSPLEVRRRLVADYKAAVVDWQDQVDAQGKQVALEELLEIETFVQVTEYDALKRMTRLYNWHRQDVPDSRVAVYEPHYNHRGLLDSEDLVVRATKTTSGYSEGAASQRTKVIQAIGYDAKGQRQGIRYGNGTATQYQYDPQTFRLTQLRTTRPGFNPAFPNGSSQLKDQRVLQNLYYSYDPVGNITEIYDDAYEPAFFQNQQVEPQSRYVYDALYRLISASGRENGAATGAPAQFEGQPETVDFPKMAANALRNYSQSYHYDPVGNIEQMQHSAGSTGSWTRAYQYATDSNRLLGTHTGNPLQAVTYQYDPHGNMLNLANVAPELLMHWDYRGMIQAFNGVGGGWTYYNYSVDKQRTRKVNESQLGANKQWERIYLGGLEIYRRYDNAGLVVEEIESLHVMDGSHRILLVEDVLQTDSAGLPLGALYRYQYGNHLGSASLELDDQAQVISYEEYHPYGTSSYRASWNKAEVSIKRYRYTGMERDEETGLSYHSSRYYALWLGRWTATDPAKLIDGINVYQFSRNNPVIFCDPSGKVSVVIATQKDEALRPKDAKKPPDEQDTPEKARHRRDENKNFKRKAETLSARMQKENKKFAGGIDVQLVDTGAKLLDVLVDASKKGPIKNLVIYGHSGPTALYMAQDSGFYRYPADNKEATGEARYFQQLSEKIKNKEIIFAKDAIVIFAGCKCAGAVAPESMALARQFTRDTGIASIASVGGSDQTKSQSFDKEGTLGSWMKFEKSGDDVKSEKLNGQTLDPLQHLRQDNAPPEQEKIKPKEDIPKVNIPKLRKLDPVPLEPTRKWPIFLFPSPILFLLGSN